MKRSLIDRATIRGLVESRAMECEQSENNQAEIKCYERAATSAARAAAFREVVRLIDDTPEATR